MNLMSLLGLRSEGPLTAAGPSSAAMGRTGERFQVLLAGALGEAGEPGSLPEGAPAALSLPGEATAGLEGESLPEAAGEDAADELMETTVELETMPDPLAEEQRAPVAWAALAGALVAPAPQPLAVLITAGMPAAPDASALAEAMAPAGLAATESKAPGLSSLSATAPGEALPGTVNPTFAGNHAEVAAAAIAPSISPPLVAGAVQKPTGGQRPALQLAAQTADPAGGTPINAAAAGAAGTALTGAPPAGRWRVAAASEEGGLDTPAVPGPQGERAGGGAAGAARPTASAATPTTSPTLAAASAAAPVPEAAAGGEDSAEAGVPAASTVASEPAGHESWTEAKPTADEPAPSPAPTGMEPPKAAASRPQASSQKGGAPVPAPSLRIDEVPEHALRIMRDLRSDGAQQYRAELRLDPPGLGRVRIDFELSVKGEGDAQHALTRITVETAAAHEQLQAELPRIRALLAEQGLGGAEVELHLRQGHGQDAQEQQAQHSPWQRGETGARELGGRQLEWRSTHDGLIDLRA